MLLVACVCGSVQGQDATTKQSMLFSGVKNMNGAGSMGIGDIGEQFKAQADAVKASMAGCK